MPAWPDEDVASCGQALFIASDINGDGELDYSEFIDMAGTRSSRAILEMPLKGVVWIQVEILFVRRPRSQICERFRLSCNLFYF